MAIGAAPVQEEAPYAAWWLWLWGLVSFALLILAVVPAIRLPFWQWAIGATVGFGAMEAWGLVHPYDAYPPLTHVIAKYVPRALAFPALYGFAAAAGAQWLGFRPHPERIAALAAFIGWLTTHFDTTFDEATTKKERAKYQRLRHGTQKAFARVKSRLTGSPP